MVNNTRRRLLCNPLNSIHRRSLNDAQKAEYINAVLCLASSPAKECIYPEVQTRFDEFQAYHIQQVRNIHAVVSQFTSDAMLVSQSMSARDNFYPGTGILCSNTKTLSGMNADIRDVLRAYFNLRFAVLPLMIHILSTATGTGL